MHITVQAAQSQLTELIDAALSGEEVVIAKDRHSLVRMVPVEVHKPRFHMGILDRELAGSLPNFLEPLSEDDLALWESRA